MDKRKPNVQPSSVNKTANTAKPPDTTMGHIVSMSDKPLPDVDLESDNLLQDYVIHDPVPLDQKAASADVKSSRWTRGQKAALITAFIVAILGISGAILWTLFRNQGKNEPIVAGNSPAEEEPQNRLLDLEFDSDDVINTYNYIDRIVYAEPFLTFYPIGELNRSDLSEDQLAVMRSEAEASAPADENRHYVHQMYSAEGDDEKIYLYEIIAIAELAECNEYTLVRSDGKCVNLYNLKGSLIQLPAGIGRLDDWWNYGDQLDHFRWTFLKNTEGTYTLENIASVKHLAEDTIRFLPQE